MLLRGIFADHEYAADFLSGNTEINEKTGIIAAENLLLKHLLTKQYK
jgi:hypothetical protein